MGIDKERERDPHTSRLRRLHHLEMSVLSRHCMRHASRENDISAC